MACAYASASRNFYKNNKVENMTHETVDIKGIRFQVLRADSRRLYTLLVGAPKPEIGAEHPTA